jgi:hypothetical protein
MLDVISIASFRGMSYFENPSLISRRVALLSSLTSQGSPRVYKILTSQSILSAINLLSKQLLPLSRPSMHITVFTTPQFHHVSQALYEYWDSGRAMFRTRTLQMSSQLRAGQTGHFEGYVKDLVSYSVCCNLVRFSFLLCSASCRLFWQPPESLSSVFLSVLPTSH